MATKDNSPKSIDITSGKKPQPSPTARPIVVTNRPMIAADPMVVNDTGSEVAAEKVDTNVPIRRQGKTIAAPSSVAPADDIPTTTLGAEEPKKEAAVKTADKPATLESSKPEPVVAAEESESLPVEEPKPKLVSDLSPAPVPEEKDEVPVPEEGQEERDPEAESLANAAAETARDAELEKVIRSGKYAVPISSSYQQSSSVSKFALIILVLVLLALLFDLALDAGLLSISGIPHTSFFK